MKRFLIILGVGLALLVTAVFFPVRHHAQDGPDSPAFNAYCPAGIGLVSTPAFIWLFDYGYNQHMKTEWLACSIKILLERATDPDEIITTRAPYIGHIEAQGVRVIFQEHVDTLIYDAMLTLLPSDRPDLAAYFLKNRLDNHNVSVAVYLGILYAEGRGVPTNTGKARHLFRYESGMHFPSKLTGNECEEYIEPRLQNPMDEYSHLSFESDPEFQFALHPLYREQIRWYQSLCHASSEDIHEIIQSYIDQNEILGLSIAIDLIKHLQKARNYKPAKKLLDEAVKRSWETGYW